jgi:hypothetical protein
MSYLQFSDEWRKEVNKFPAVMLINLFPNKETDLTGLSKKQIIDKLRLELIVKQFNEWYPVGCTLYWKPIAKEGIEPIFVTVKHKAYISPSNQAVAFFNERSSYCSIEPEFIAIREPYQHQFEIA